MVKNISSVIIESNDHFDFDELETQCKPVNTIQISNANEINKNCVNDKQ